MFAASKVTLDRTAAFRCTRFVVVQTASPATAGAVITSDMVRGGGGGGEGGRWWRVWSGVCSLVWGCGCAFLTGRPFRVFLDTCFMCVVSLRVCQRWVVVLMRSLERESSRFTAERVEAAKLLNTLIQVGCRLRSPSPLTFHPYRPVCRPLAGCLQEMTSLCVFIHLGCTMFACRAALPHPCAAAHFPGCHSHCQRRSGSTAESVP
jgi:hypothetical protein